MTPYFFGYGSLVNRNTHDYPDAHPAQLRGWRRSWVKSKELDRIFLSVRPDPGTTIHGLIAAVPGADWQALDAREAGYVRTPSNGSILHPLSPEPEIVHYAVPDHHHGETTQSDIALSYIDVVVQGFLREYGQQGVAEFFDTTDGWDTPIVNDRADPRYPRHQRLTAQETELVDYHLSRVSARLA